MEAPKHMTFNTKCIIVGYQNGSLTEETMAVVNAKNVDTNGGNLRCVQSMNFVDIATVSNHSIKCVALCPVASTIIRTLRNGVRMGKPILVLCSSKRRILSWI